MKRLLTIILLTVSLNSFSQGKSISIGGNGNGGGGISSETDPVYSTDSAMLKTVLQKKNNSDSSNPVSGYRTIGMANKVRDSLVNIIGKKADTTTAIKFTLTNSRNNDLFKYDSANAQIINVRLISVTATLDFPSTTSSSVSDLTIATAGASVGDAVWLSLPASLTATANFTAWVSAANTVTVRFSPKATEDPTPASFTVKIFPK